MTLSLTFKMSVGHNTAVIEQKMFRSSYIYKMVVKLLEWGEGNGDTISGSVSSSSGVQNFLTSTPVHHSCLHYGSSRVRLGVVPF